MRTLFTVAAVLCLAISVALFWPQAASGSGGAQVTGCLAHHPKYAANIEIEYTPGCTGHDEPELMPVSSAAGSGRDLTWTLVLPTDGSNLVSDVGPTFWF